MRYECLPGTSGCTYRIYVTHYFDCAGVPPGINPGNFTITPNGTCSTPTALGGWVAGTNNEVTPICPSNLSMTTCNGPGGVLYGVSEVVYYWDYDFCSSFCSSYSIEVETCCRNGSGVNIVNPNTYSLYDKMTIYPNGMCNSAPEFLDPNAIIIESGSTARVSMAAYDADGDSLAYELTNCYSNATTPLPYNIGYSATQPMGPSWGVNLDPRTGDLTFNPNPGNIGSYVLCMEVIEYRNGILIGQYPADFTVMVVANSPITNINPTLPYGGVGSPPVTGGMYIDTFIVSATVNTNLMIPIHASDPDNDSVRMAWSENILGASFYQSGNPSITDTIFDLNPQAIFSWTPLQPGRYSFTVDLEDVGCHLTGTSEFTYIVDVDTVATPTCNLQVNLGPDQAACDGDSVLLIPSVSGGTPPYSYLWSTGETTPNIYVTVSGMYMLFVSDAMGCIESDTINISFSPLPVVDAGLDTMICPGTTAQLFGTSSANPSFYQWLPSTNLNNANIANPVFTAPATPGAYTFQMIATDANGCANDDIVIITVANDLAISFAGPDTICSSDTANIAYTGNTQPAYTYTWDFDGGNIVSGAGEGPYDIEWSGTGYGWKTVTLTVNTGLCDFTNTTQVYVDPNCVWPGDADYDGVANNNDLLAIGLSYGSTGPARSNASIMWTAQPAFPWNDTIPGGVNYVHSDTDGNGAINDDDTLAIITNYGQSHNRLTEEGNPGDPPLLLLPMVDSSNVGDTLHLPIHLGVDTIPADNVYGLAFSITYDNTLVDSASASVRFSPSWLGMGGVNLLSMQKDLFTAGRIDVAVTRTDQMDISGFGQLGYLSIVMVDDISGKNALSEILELKITNVRMISSDGSELPVNPGEIEIVVSETSTGIDKWADLTTVKVYPNPTPGLVFIESEVAEELNIEIFNLQGQRIEAITTRETQVQLDLSAEAKGLYLISVSNKTSRLIQKIQLR